MLVVLEAGSSSVMAVMMGVDGDGEVLMVAQV